MEDQLHLEEFLPYRLSHLSNTISACIAATYRDRYSLSVTEWRTIAILGRFADISAGEVARKGALDKVAVSRAVNRLIERGLLTKHMASDDRRRSVLALSEQGERIYSEIAPAANAFERHLLATFTDAERQQLDYLIDKLWQQLEPKA